MRQPVHGKQTVTSVALMLLVVFSVLQVCSMSVQAALPSGAGNTGQSNHHADNSDLDMAGMLGHSCCLESEHTETDLTCQDCESSDELIKVSPPDTLKPLFSLLYLTFQELLVVSHEARFWQSFIEPDIQSSLPDIYLSKVVFLE